MIYIDIRLASDYNAYNEWRKGWPGMVELFKQFPSLQVLISLPLQGDSIKFCIKKTKDDHKVEDRFHKKDNLPLHKLKLQQTRTHIMRYTST